MYLKKLLLFFLSLYSFQFILAEPPEPEVGTRWILNTQYSDEFEGNTLDTNKWRNSYKGWQGRSPAKFIPEAVSVKNGYMQIQNGILKKKRKHKSGEYTIQGGAVQSLNKTAHYGYYECKFKASRINMSTTFWMSNGKTSVNYPTRKSNGKDCSQDRFSQELDICEAVGGTLEETGWAKDFRKKMNFNTHFRYIDCNGGKEKFYSKGNNAAEGNGTKANAWLSSESGENFHIYAAHWKSANEVDFYADNKAIGSVQVSTAVIDKPFARPMGINMVTETYDWAKPYPTNKELINDKINTSYYDWVRSYELIGAKQFPNLATKKKPSPIFKEGFSFYDKVTFAKDKSTITLPYLYKANENRILSLEIITPSRQKIFETRIKLYAGYGKNIKTIDLKGNFKPENKIVAKFKSINGQKTIKSLLIK